MLLKPYISPKVNVNSLLSDVSRNPHTKDHCIYQGLKPWEYNESIEFLESEGRLLMLTTLYHERSLKYNKRLHDIRKVFECMNTWPVCLCNFAKTIRGYDLGLSIDRIDYLREIL